MPKHLVFLTNLISPLHGEFNAGDTAKNVPDDWANDLITAGVARETTVETEKADAAAAATAAGKIVRGGQPPDVNGKPFDPSDERSMVAAGIVKTPFATTDRTAATPAVSAPVNTRVDLDDSGAPILSDKPAVSTAGEATTAGAVTADGARMVPDSVVVRDGAGDTAATGGKKVPTHPSGPSTL